MSERTKTHTPVHEGLQNDFSEQEGSMQRSAMPPPFRLEASKLDKETRSGDGGEDSLLWLLQATWNSGDREAFWRLVENRRPEIVLDGDALRWLKAMNGAGAFARQGDTVPLPMLEMATGVQDRTRTGLPQPKLVELPEVVITAHTLAPPERPYWRLLHREATTDYHFAQRGTTFFIVAETAVNSGGSAYHYITFDRPDGWKEFFPRDRNFNAELRGAVMDNMPLLQFAELVAEEGVWMILGEVVSFAELGRLALVAGAGRKAAREGVAEGMEGIARREVKEGAEGIAGHTPLAPKAEGRGAPMREVAEGLGESAEAAAHTVGDKGAIRLERATRMRTRMLAKVGGDLSRPLKFTDAELAEFLDHAAGLGFGEGDIEAMLSMKVRIDKRNPRWVLRLDTMQKVAESLAAKSQSHQIAFREGWDFMRAYREAQEKMIKEGKGLDPKEYLEEWYIERHLKDFEKEACYLVTGKAYKNWVVDMPLLGREDGQYLSTLEEVARVRKKASGDISIVEIEMGIPVGEWQNQNGLYRIDVLQPKSLNLRLPNGFENGANEFWHPGGFTSGGAQEAVVNQIPNELGNVHTVRLNEFD